ncbi:helix-turn-helix domain-containing protein [Streptomyces sp. ISL-96]|uniref:helix-turn-helix domain-containing protein n=1 Tax=Streptomyces sp. ISL-96 TaxID=2819191 RepID=UPI0027E23A53|nr:helix-turn-helix domain-containing protein [Streptomyces sp. ISL-96]
MRSCDLIEEGARRRLGVGRARDTLPQDHYVSLIRLVSLRAMARSAGVSTRHLTRLFRERTGSSPAGFVESVRLEAARILLEAGPGSPERPRAVASAATRACAGPSPGTSG